MRNFHSEMRNKQQHVTLALSHRLHDILTCCFYCFCLYANRYKRFNKEVIKFLLQ